MGIGNIGGIGGSPTLSALQQAVEDRKQCFQLQVSTDLCVLNSIFNPSFTIPSDLQPTMPCIKNAKGHKRGKGDIGSIPFIGDPTHAVTLCDLWNNPPKAWPPEQIYYVLAPLAIGIFPTTGRNCPSSDFWDTCVLKPMSEHLDILDDGSDFGANALLRLMYLHGTEAARGDIGTSDSNNNDKIHCFPPDVQDKIRTSLLNFKYWLDEPYKASQIPGKKNKNEEMTFWSENHQILFSTAELLAGRLWPNEYFPKGKMSGSQHMEKARKRILNWLNARLQFGFSEWNSPSYYDEDICALLNLIDFSGDAMIITMASMVLDLLIFDLARFTFSGMFGGTAGRGYFEHKSCIWEQSIHDLIEILFAPSGGFTFVSPGSNSAHAFASTINYQVPDVLLKIGKDLAGSGPLPDILTPPLVDKSRVSINFDEAQNYGIGFGSDEDVVFWWGHGAYFYPDKLNKASHNLASRYNLLDTNPFKIASAAGWGIVTTELIGAIAALGVLGPQLAFIFSTIDIGDSLSGSARDSKTAPFARGSSLTRANIYTYRNTGAMLSSVQNFNSGWMNAQSHVCQATLGNGATVWTTHPPVHGTMLSIGEVVGGATVGGILGAIVPPLTLIFESLGSIYAPNKISAFLNSTRTDDNGNKVLPDDVDPISYIYSHDGPNYWTGSVTLPRVVQQFGAAIIAYEPNAFQFGLFGSRTHAWFPRNSFDNGTVFQKPSLNCNIDGGLWTFGAVVDGYVALYSGQTPKWTESGTWANKEIISEGKRNVFILQVGDKKEFGSYNAFTDVVTRARIHINGLHWALANLECSYDIPGRDRLELHYDENKVRYAGQPLDDDNFPRYDNPFTNVKWGQQSYTINTRAFNLHHDIKNFFRSGDGISDSPSFISVKPQ